MLWNGGGGMTDHFALLARRLVDTSPHDLFAFFKVISPQRSALAQTEPRSLL